MYLEREKDVGAGGGRVQVGPPGLAGVCVTQRSKRKQEAGEKEGEGEATENPGQHAHSGSEAGRGFAARGSGSERRGGALLPEAVGARRGGALLPEGLLTVSGRQHNRGHQGLLVSHCGQSCAGHV